MAIFMLLMVRRPKKPTSTGGLKSFVRWRVLLTLNLTLSKRVPVCLEDKIYSTPVVLRVNIGLISQCMR
jgi:hypothetical protein